MPSLRVITPFLFYISCCWREEKRLTYRTRIALNTHLPRFFLRTFFGKPSYSLYVWRKKFANHVLPSVVCVVVAIFVARGYIETNLQKSSSHPRLCEEGSLTAILHVTDYDSCVFLHAEFFWQTPILECVCVGYFLFRCGCQLAEVHISSLLIWGKVPWQLFYKSCSVCVEHFLFQFVSRGYREQLAQVHIPTPLIRMPS